MHPKPYAISFEVKGEILHARASGVRNQETVSAVTLEVFQAAVAHGTPKVLVDVRAFEGRLGVLGDYDLVSDVFDPLRGKGVKKAAVVDTPDPGSAGSFLDTVARNRGFNIRTFATLEAALEWLAQ